MAVLLKNLSGRTHLIHDNSGALRRLEPNDEAVVDLEKEDAVNFPGIVFKDTDLKPQALGTRPDEYMEYAEIQSFLRTTVILDVNGVGVRLGPNEKRVVRDLDKASVRVPGIVVREISASKAKGKKVVEGKPELHPIDSANLFGSKAHFMDWAKRVPLATLRAFALKHSVRARGRGQLITRLRRVMYGE